MKHLIFIISVFMFLSCSETKTYSPAETAKIVATSFLHNDKSTLKKHTTAVAYANLTSIQDMFIEEENSDINFKVVDQAIDGEIAWIKYTTHSDSKPGVFKLVKVDNQWKVDHNGPRERGPF